MPPVAPVTKAIRPWKGVYSWGSISDKKDSLEISGAYRWRPHAAGADSGSFGAMLSDQFRHAFKTEVGFHRFLMAVPLRRRRDQRTPVNPRRRQSDCLGRHMVVEEALRDMQDASGIAAEVSSHPGEQEFKIGQRRFVRADLLSGKNRCPRDRQGGQSCLDSWRGRNW